MIVSILIPKVWRTTLCEGLLLLRLYNKISVVSSRACEERRFRPLKRCAGDLLV